MISTVLWTLCFLGFVGLFVWQVYRRLRVLLKTRPAPERFENIPRRVREMLVGAIGQMKFFTPGQDQPAGAIHALVFWGFLVLGLQITTMFLRGWADGAYLPLMGPHLLGGPYMLVRDLMEAVVLGCAAVLLVRWLVTHPRRLMGFKPAEQKLASHSHWEAIVILLFISTIMITGLLYDGGRMVYLAHDPAFGPELDAERMWAPLSRLASVWLSGAGPDTAHAVSNGAWWVHNLVVLSFLNLLPLSKHFHVVTSIPNVFFTKLEPYGRLSKQDLENAEIYGTSKMSHFTWKQVLDMYTCTECGRCSAECPATATNKPLAPRQMLLDLRNYLYEHPESVLNPNGETVIGEHTGVTDEVLWSCTSCRACEEACPVHIEYVDKIVDMRRHLVQEEARFPAELTRTFKGMETQGNPWGMNADKRDEWTEGLDIPHISAKPDAEYLFFVGCAGSFDDRAKKITKAVAKILNAAGVSYAILGKEEPCNGDTARRLGNEYLYQTMAGMAVEVLNGYSVRKVITNCPHCFNTIANEFPQFGGNYEVVHAAQVVADLIGRGKVKIDPQAAKSVVYHDSCYLGRYNEVYDPPRDILKAIPGLVLKEAERSRNKGMCCGAGGGRMWIEENPTQRVNTLRVEQLLTTKPDVIASACPYCMTMLSDGVKEKQLEEKVQTRDILEILADAVA
jgi:Fe-S oxidoreductase